MGENTGVQSVTLDTGLLIELIDEKPNAIDVRKILQWHKEGKISVHVSNRLFDHDTTKMAEDQTEKLRQVLNENGVEIHGSLFRGNFSRLSGSDLLSGGRSTRSPIEMEEFRRIVGPDPANLPKKQVGKKLSNKLGDYDSLLDHFAASRDVFLTLDTKDYLSTCKRERYKADLNLIVLHPAEFVANNLAFNG